MDIFERINNLAKKGIIIDVVAVNQIENRYQEQVKVRDMPLITYSVEVMNVDLDDVFHQESCKSLKEALEAGVKWAEGYNSWRIE